LTVVKDNSNRKVGQEFDSPKVHQFIRG